MSRSGVLLRIHGAENARGSIIRFRSTTYQKINTILQSETPHAVNRMREAMQARYIWGSGRADRSLKGAVETSESGASVSISITNFREVKYLTTLLSDSEFMPNDYPIFPSEASRLVFFWKRRGRVVALKSVMHPGMGPDVLRLSAESELSRLGYLVEYQVRSAVAEVVSGGRVLRVSGRR